MTPGNRPIVSLNIYHVIHILMQLSESSVLFVSIAVLHRLNHSKNATIVVDA